MENKSTKCMYLGLDVGKFLCAFLILFYHYFSEHGSLLGLLGEALSLYAVAVALFMTISGFLIYNKLEKIDSREERWRVVKNRLLEYTEYIFYGVFRICCFQFCVGIGAQFQSVLFFGKFRGGFSNLHFIQFGLCLCWQLVHC